MGASKVKVVLKVILAYLILIRKKFFHKTVPFSFRLSLPMKHFSGRRGLKPRLRLVRLPCSQNKPHFQQQQSATEFADKDGKDGDEEEACGSARCADSIYRY